MLVKYQTHLVLSFSLRLEFVRAQICHVLLMPFEISVKKDVFIVKFKRLLVRYMGFGIVSLS